MSVTVGHDSEFGLMRDGIIVSALDHLEPGECEAGSWFPDNLNAEIAITPSSTLEEFNQKTDELLNRVRDQGFELLMKPVIRYPDEALQNKDAYISGCNPDFCGYTARTNKAPDFNEMDGTRSCGAHIHIGDKGVDVANWARWMDALVALPLLFEEEPNERRSLYGGPAALRRKPYGGEYRTLSNVWLDNPELREFVWAGAHKALDLAKELDSRVIDQWELIPTSIANHDLKLAQDAIDLVYLKIGAWYVT